MNTRTVTTCSVCGRIKESRRAECEAQGHAVRTETETLRSIGGLSKCCDCPRSKWKTCAHSWYASYKGHRTTLGQFESKPKAEEAFAKMKDAIDNGRPCPCKRCQAARPAPDAPVTLDTLGATYFKEYVNPKTGEKLSHNERIRWDLIMRTEIERPNGARVQFGSLPVKDVTRHDVDAFRKAHLEARTVTVTNAKGHVYEARRGGKSGVRGCLGRLRAFYGWAVDKDYVVETPFRKGGQAVKGLFVHEPERERRLEPGEWEKLFAAANAHLQALMTAAIETGCRVGELLSLQWRQVRFDLNEIHLRAEDTKARRARLLPMSQRLRALLDMRKTAAEKNKAYKPDAFAFGDEIGGQVKSVKTAWENCRLKAHGYKVQREKNGRLTAECREQLRRINLHFHDLRREAGSRFLEGGMPANVVQQFLDHAKLSTTSRYLKINRDGMHAALKRFEKSREKEAADAVPPTVSASDTNTTNGVSH